MMYARMPGDGILDNLRRAGRGIKASAVRWDQSSGRSPDGAIFTSRGMNRARTRTRSSCALMTLSISLYAHGASSSPAEINVTPCCAR